jgi:GNAT superfamily N-acetyltransferase
MIKEITDSENLQKAINLINQVFAEFVAVDYSQQGRDTFENYLKIKNDELSSDLKSGHKKLWGYYESGEIIGVIGLRDNSHISLMFVDKQHQKKGIAKALFNHLLAKTGVSKITVNSSPYAQPIYEKLGFVKTAEKQEKDGIIFIPMMYQ